MIDLDDVAGALHRDCNNGYLLHDEIEDFIEKLRQAEKDAARYRWLRDKAHTVTGLTPCAFVMKDGELMEDWNGQYGLLFMGALDLAVDEAILENQA